MIKEKNSMDETISLRHQAEERLIKKRSEKVASLNEADALKLIHELEVHQIELEMQNEQLRAAELKASEVSEKLVALYDFAPTGYFTLDRDSMIKSLNLSGARMLGNERSGFLNKNFRRFITPETLEVFNDFLMKVFETYTKQTCEVRVITKADISRFILIEGIVSKEEQECFLTAIDITEREIAEEKLRNSEMRYRGLFEYAKEGILILDARKGQIIDVNPFLIKLLGYSYEEFLGKELWEIGFFKDIKDSKNALIELQITGYLRYDDLPLKSKSGKLINVEVVCNVYMVDHARVIQCNIRDIQERKLTEAILKENEIHLRKLIATKDKFFSIIAHDLKSPFNSIIGFSNLLAEQVRKKDFKEVEEYAEIIQNSSWRAMDLLTNLLEWSRSQTGRIEFNPKNIYLDELINEVTELLDDSAKQKSITILSEVPEHLPFVADKAMISTVLRNLITNAVKFTNPGGSIIISAIPDDKELMVSVSDNGIGIKKDAISKLFRIEESISTSDTEGKQGTGLGLLICYDFISKHGGKIWAESISGTGTKFIFTLPLLTDSQG